MHHEEDGVGARRNPEPVPIRSDGKQQEIAGLLSSILDDRCTREEVRTALRPLCIQAREENVDVAELVKLVKQSFAGAHPVRTAALALERQRQLDQVISVCIDEYYATG